MSRALAMLAGSLMLSLASIGTARADMLGDQVATLADASASYKERLAAELALSKSKDARAVIALADALGRDGSSTIRRVAALGLERAIDGHTADDARALAFEALDRAAGRDSDDSVKRSAAATLVAIGHYRRGKGRTPVATSATAPRGDRPEVLVKIDPSTDPGQKAPAEVTARLTTAVKGTVEHAGYATAWPGGMPTAADLNAARSHAYVIASTVKKIETARVGRQTQVACTVSIRVAPWGGRDGGEKWEASRAAQAEGSAKATTGSTDREIKGGMRDCLEAVAEDLTARQIIPFLRRLVVAGN